MIRQEKLGKTDMGLLHDMYYFVGFLTSNFRNSLTIYKYECYSLYYASWTKKKGKISHSMLGIKSKSKDFKRNL